MEEMKRKEQANSSHPSISSDITKQDLSQYIPIEPDKIRQELKRIGFDWDFFAGCQNLFTDYLNIPCAITRREDLPEWAQDTVAKIWKGNEGEIKLGSNGKTVLNARYSRCWVREKDAKGTLREIASPSTATNAERERGVVYESIEVIFYRVTMGAIAVRIHQDYVINERNKTSAIPTPTLINWGECTTEKLKKLSKSFYEMMVSFRFIPAGRTLRSVGAGKAVVANCVVLDLKPRTLDNLDVIVEAIRLQERGSGVGFPFHMVEPGEIGNSNIGANGLLVQANNMLDFIKDCGRKGANMAVMSVEHPDILDFFYAKSKSEFDLPNFNISVSLSDRFMNLLSTNPTAQWICQFEGKEYLPREYVRERNGMNVISFEEKVMSVQEVFDLLVERAWCFGDPGCVFLDTVNRYEPSFSKINACNPCVPGDTLISTANEGLRRVDELIDKPFVIKVQGKHILVEGFKKTKEDAELLELTTTHGFTMKATANHRVLLSNGEDFVEMKDLKPERDRVTIVNQRSAPHCFDICDKQEFMKGYTLASLMSNGSITDLEGFIPIDTFVYGDCDSIILIDPIGDYLMKKKQEKDYVKCGDSYFLKSYHLKRLGEDYGLSKENMISSREKIMSETQCFHRGLFSSLFDGDGQLDIRLRPGPQIRLWHEDSGFVRLLQTILIHYGIFSSIESDLTRPKASRAPTDEYLSETQIVMGHDLCIRHDSVLWFWEFVKPKILKKEERFNKLIEEIGSAPEKWKRTHFWSTVKTIQKVEKREDVYDCTVPDLSVFPANGVVVHNCGEQFLHDGDVCNLGSINLDAFTQIDGPVVKIDTEGVALTANAATNFLDCVIDLSKYHESFRDFNRINHRRIGLGIMGLGDLLYRLGIPYDSNEGRKKAEELMKLITETSRFASEILGSIYGRFRDWEKSYWPKLFRNMRNISHTTIPPTGSTSMLPGVTSGCEPNFCLAFQQKHILDGKTTLQVFNERFAEAIQKFPIDTQKVIKDHVLKKGDISELSDEVVPETFKRVFCTAMTISGQDHLSMVITLQKQTSNAVTKTINLPNKATLEDVANIYMRAWKEGCKGLTIYRDGSRTVQVLNAGIEDVAEKKEEEEESNKGREIIEEEEKAGDLVFTSPLNINSSEDDPQIGSKNTCVRRTPKCPTPGCDGIVVMSSARCFACPECHEEGCMRQIIVT